ncbi:MAG TPA: hypothetical protein VE080_01955, partial [Candidatus Aquicultoraceae bacterium]|nr:hypothetical protein [Candidatus Aquicultoraceae bacterium]
MPRAKGPGAVPFIRKHLARAYPAARVVLRYRTPFELLVATILAAQCTDERVNRVTPGLFERYPGPGGIAAAPAREIEEIIRSTGFYRNKAKALKGVSSGLLERYGGEVPRTMEDLTSLPGVGRKTAAVLLGACFGA